MTQAKQGSDLQLYDCFQQTKRQRVSDGAIVPILEGCSSAARILVLLWSQLGDFDNLEYAWWLQREAKSLREAGIAIRAVGIGDRGSGEQFCAYTGFPADCLFVDPKAELHQQLDLYQGLLLKLPLLSPGQNAWLNLLLMCAGIGSPGTLSEVFRGYRGDRKAPQLIADEETVKAPPLPPLKGSSFRWAGGKGYQRPFELATLRLRNMGEVLSHWKTYVPDSAYLTQRGATFLFDAEGQLLYEHRDRAILGFAEDKSKPLSFLTVRSD
ncbi:peroxiredoxin-like family protein [Leptolyngbya sp. FACHB-711]|uniref:peroxiredoxin-like family protein n=1 Tax=unclassified Leptolyngbya TaxID=2650499 RepID=UPI0016831D91|nr:peroxiredoxin-like family protein [Leptolyngbya sp. FACHB-711]MBD1852088.1 AhpC/TSA family protein [Cyanobacteria bacterium FACHB-502]MBD2024804.1 AhpC/TSA family protein [Leptolyngbya sp. FACHB-711]